MTGLFHDFGSGGEHGEERKADFRLTDEDHIDALKQDAEEPDDDAERCIVDVSEERWENVTCEHLDFFAHRRGELCFVGLVDTVFNNVKDVEVHDNHGEHCDALLFVKVAEDALDCTLHFGVGKDRDEGVGGCREWIYGGHDLHFAPESRDQVRPLVVPVDVDLEWRLAGNRSYQLRPITLMYFQLQKRVIDILDSSKQRLFVCARDR